MKISNEKMYFLSFHSSKGTAISVKAIASQM